MLAAALLVLRVATIDSVALFLRQVERFCVHKVVERAGVAV